ncbi:peptidylprolyl isomerase [Candidatus Aerophobetes bacterium]|uniref:Peptidyl-prolyl cis-trans isomerase n=1 Tax=Aerophobetes bacterium TaxID=2030807 RepID=A0A2A4YKH0_UNCAE|nr:MAG: peptidylprolyl isomerase [Candidatus Aerophobetes bacterium]
MSKKTLYKLFASCFLAGFFLMQPSTLLANEETQEKGEEVASVEEATSEEKSLDLPMVSEAFGHVIGKNLESLGFEFDMESIIKGIQDSVAGKDSPMGESECVHAISQEQEKKFKKLAEDNLKVAEVFLEENAAIDGIVSLEENKLQYKIDQAGEGEVVEAHYTPMIKYTGKHVDGKVFGSSKEAETISLDETIPGFSRGIVGMKEGEIRTLYIHPDFGYGTNGYLPPNSLLTFEIELVKANNFTEADDSDTISSLPDDMEDGALVDEESMQ